MEKIEISDVIKGAVAGLVGGIVATVVMGGFQAFLSALAEEEKKLKKKKGRRTGNGESRQKEFGRRV